MTTSIQNEQVCTPDRKPSAIPKVLSDKAVLNGCKSGPLHTLPHLQEARSRSATSSIRASVESIKATGGAPRSPALVSASKPGPEVVVIQEASRSPRRVSDLLVQHLNDAGVTHVFGVPGGALTPLFTSLANQDCIKPIMARHETGAAFMADGYARVRRTLGVCCATSGPGATNALTGLACAYADSVPVMLLSGQVATHAFGKSPIQDGTSHGVDVVRIFESVTKLSAMLPSAESANPIIQKAIRTALSGRPGPIHLSLPGDILQQPAKTEATPFRQYYAPAYSCDLSNIGDAAETLAKAKRPVIFAGYGVVASTAWPELRALAEAVGAPVVTTPRAKGAFPESHPLSLGIFGFGGHQQAEKYLTSGEVDVLLVVGSSLSEFSTNGWDRRIAPRTSLIQIDIDPTELGKNYPVHHGIVGDAKTALAALQRALRQHIRSPRYEPAASVLSTFKVQNPRYYEAEKCKDDSIPLKPQRMMTAMRRVLPENTLCFVDIGNSMLWFPHYFEMAHPASYVVNMGMAAMGYSIPAAIGGKLAAPHRPVIALAGDGAFAMHGMEIHTAVEHNLPMIFIILNDAGLGMVDQGEGLLAGRRVSPARYGHAMDIAGVASSLGALAYRVYRPQDFEDALREAIREDRPCVIDARIDPNEVPPMLRMRAESLKQMFTQK